MQTIYNVCLQSHNLVNFRLQYRDRVVDQNQTVKSYLQPYSNVVLFWLKSASKAIKQELSSPIARSAETGTIRRSIPRSHLEPPADSENILQSLSAARASYLTQSDKKLPIIPQESPCSGPNSSTLLSPDTISQERGIHHERLPGLFESAVQTERYISAILEQQDPELLETAVARSVQMLSEFKILLSRYAASNEDARSWKHAIETLTPQAAQTRTVIGVIGHTGAGKSSVINALLDEERLVPTNCMRACTAVVTETSWNDSADASSKYRAEIEFIDQRDWEEELTVLMKDFSTGDGTISRDTNNPDSDAGIAWAKFHCVYPDVPRDALQRFTVSELMTKINVLSILGTTKWIQTAHASEFYQQLQDYVDSKKYSNRKSRDHDRDKSKATKTKRVEYWPLIKLVRIYAKSSALSTGAVIVDLPGVHDTNAA
jgi:hypothetical protein